MAQASSRAYFGGKIVGVATDRMGTVRWAPGAASMVYRSYGTERTWTTSGWETWATYSQLAQGMDYADQRMYNSGMGKFFSPDPGGAAGADAADPLSWNRYLYAMGDPVNRVDPGGTDSCLDEFGLFGGQGGTGCRFPFGTGWNCFDPSGVSVFGLLCYAPVPVPVASSDSGGGGAGPGPAGPSVILGLKAVGDCFYPSGNGLIGTYLVAITYQVINLIGGASIVGNGTLTSSVGTISESVTKTGGTADMKDVITGGTWCTVASTDPACKSTPGSLLSSGQFTDWYALSSGTLTATQSYAANGSASSGGSLPLLGSVIGIAGQTNALNSFYSSSLVKVNGTVSPRACGAGDPTLR